ncbi:MAG: hypothetical protein H6918_08510 [Sphingomonadaceae bacterium]|nr:hypothetical protein [Sphingomonadaceae bacterium]
MASMEGEELVQQLTRSIFISADEETVAGGVILYFLRVEGGEVLALRTSTLTEDDLLQAQSRLEDQQWLSGESALPGKTFLLGEMVVPVSIYLGEDRSEEQVPLLKARGIREEQLFITAQRLAEGRRGFMVAAYPATDPDSLAGGGFFLPQD